VAAGVAALGDGGAQDAGPPLTLTESNEKVRGEFEPRRTTLA